MDNLSAKVLPARPSPELFVPEEAAGLPESSFCRRQAAVQRATGRARRPATFHSWLDPQGKPKWVVYAKPPLHGPQHVLQYLARYTHRVAISNGRLVSLADDRVHFRWRDSKDGKRLKIMSLEAVEFIRRFLLHVLPVGFVKIRHFGFLANRNRAQALALCRQHLHSGAHDLSLSELLTPEQRQAMERRCPHCRQGTLHLVALLSVEELMIYMHPTTAADFIDSS